jgi:hypothetical protein
MREIIVGVGIVVLVLILRFLAATLRMWLTALVHVVLLPVSLVQLVLGYRPWASRIVHKLERSEVQYNHTLDTALVENENALAAYRTGMQWLQRNHK